MHPSREVGTVVSDWAAFLSANTTAGVMDGTAPSCAWVLHDTSSAGGLDSGFAIEQSFFKFFQ